MAGVSNPSQLLINRNPPRSPAHPQLAPTSTSPQHSTTWRPPQALLSSDEDEDEEAELEVIDVELTFRKDASWPGSVRVLVGANEFWCHKDILVFGSAFFQSLLLGDWAETTRVRPASFSSTVSVPQSQFTFASEGIIDEQQAIDPSTLALEKLDLSEESLPTPKDSVYHDAPEDANEAPTAPAEGREQTVVSGITSDAVPEGQGFASDSTLLQPVPPQSRPQESRAMSRKRKRSKRNLKSRAGSHGHTSRPRGAAVATVDLVDERASVFQDFLRWIYPNLECKITWTNVEGLYTVADRLINTSLKQAAHSFLMTHASGKPIIAMTVAEMHDNAELYREASRFVLDLGAWIEEDMAVLSDRTRMKLLMRRNWFLDRLVKLQATDVRREYQCHPSCPDLATCQRLLDDKWRLAQATLSRYGSPQPSVAFRCLRLLETYPTNPSLLLTHTVCQNTAKSWVMSLFDRMFQPRHSFPQGTEKYWLFVTLN